MRSMTLPLMLGCVLTVGAGTAAAVPITYIGTLAPGVAVTDINNQAPGDVDVPVGADYWRFAAVAGSTVDVIGDRLAGHYDMAFWVFAGTFADTNAFGAFFDLTDPGIIGYFDDQDAANLPGPFGDPHATFVAPSSGFYTVAVTSNLSAQNAPNPYRLQATGISAVPEPASLALFAAGAVLARRRLSARR